MKKELSEAVSTPLPAPTSTPTPALSLPLDSEGRPVKFIVIGGTLYELGEGDGEQLTLKKQGPVLQPELPKLEPPPVKPPSPNNNEV